MRRVSHARTRTGDPEASDYWKLQRAFEEKARKRLAARRVVFVSLPIPPGTLRRIMPADCGLGTNGRWTFPADDPLVR